MEYNSVFFVSVSGENFDSLESFRKRLLVHLRKIGFRHTRILVDDVSTQLARDIYPQINDIENRLRCFIVNFFIQKVGLNWWEVTAPKSVIEKVKSRQGNETYFSNYIDCDVTLCDFDDLGELIYKQTTGFNSPDKIIEKIMNSNTQEDLDKLKSELQSNYTKYFKESFQDKSFDKKWKQLFAVRNKVAHNNLLTAEDKSIVVDNVDYIKNVIHEAEGSIKDFTFTTEDKKAFLDASASQLNNESDSPINESVASNGIKVLGKVDLDSIGDGAQSRFKVIDEDTLVAQINFFHRDGSDVSVKGVAETLASRGYDKRLIYILTDLMVDKGILEYYVYYNQYGFETRGVKVLTSDVVE